MTPLLTPREVAELLRVSPRTVYRLARARELASVAVGQSVRFRAQDVAAYVDRCAAAARVVRVAR